jgi:hypothetical protein
LKAVLQGVQKDFGKCLTSADVKTRVLMSLQKFVMSGICFVDFIYTNINFKFINLHIVCILKASDFVVTADSVVEHKIEIFPQDHLPLDSDKVDELFTKINISLRQCDSKEEVIQLLHDEVKDFVTNKDFEAIKPKHDESWISVAAQEVLTKLSARIDELTAENDELRGFIAGLKKQQAETFKLASASDLAIMKLESKIDNAVSSFQEPVKEVKKMLGGIPYHPIHNLSRTMSNFSINNSRRFSPRCSM